MNNGHPESAPLPAEHATFIESGVSIVVASRNSDNRPSIARAVGCRVGDDGRRITVLLRPSRSADLIRDLGDSRQIAVVFSQPSTHRSMQLKGRDPEFAPLLPDDDERARRHTEEFADELEPFAYTREMVRAMHGSSPNDVLAVAFTPLETFSQTPGPRAGERLP